MAQLKWRHSGYHKEGWTTTKEKQNGQFFRSKLREFFFKFSNIPENEAVDYSQKQIGDWLDTKDVKYYTPDENKLVIYSEKLEVGFGITFYESNEKGIVNYTLVHLNLYRPEDEDSK